MNERERIELQRQNWLKERNVEKKMKEYGLEDTDSNAKSSGKLLTELTMKLTEKLEKEMQCTTQTKNDNKKIESVLTKEIEQNTCPICYELMVPPTYSPILLFPCGHTFCKQCVYQQKTRITKCPFCRKQIASSAINISLQNLICAFTDNKHLINKYNEVEEMKTNAMHQEETEINEEFKNNLKMAQLRCKILEQEKAEIYQLNSKLVKEISSNKSAIDVLKKDKKQLIEQIEKLSKEVSLIEQYIEKSSDEITKFQNEIDQNKEKIDIIESTLKPIKEQSNKYKVLMQIK